MNHADQVMLGEILEELCAIYRHPYSQELVSGYYRYLKEHSVSAVRQAVLRLMADTTRKQVVPLPAEIKALAPRFERSRHGPDLEDERWRRQYDVWQRGRFSDEALEVSFKLSDDELGVETRGGEEERYLRCQQPQCETLIPWATDRHDEGRMFCPSHQSADVRAHPVTREEKHAMLAQATPGAKSFLRSIDVIARLMTEIPVRPDEQAMTDADAIPLRARAFEKTAEGPGVNPSVFLNHPFLADGFPGDYAERRQMVAAAGWKFAPSKGYWTKGKRKLSDEQIDSFGDTGFLVEFLGRRSAPRAAASKGDTC